MSKSHFVYKLVPPRASFASDMTDAEQAVMEQHFAYWSALFEDGSVVLFGVVLEGPDAWGLAIVEAENEEALRAIASADPAVTTGLGVMPQPVVRPRQAA